MLQYEKIVIGSSLTAVLYAFNNNLPIFFAEERRPFRFDYLEPAIDLSRLKIPTCNKSLTTFDGKKKVGVAKELLWERLLFLLSLSGNVPLSNLCRGIRYDGHRLVCSNEYSKILELTFDECHHFGDRNSFGMIEQKTLDPDLHMCYDYIAFNKGGKHETDYIYTGDDLASEIWFYPSGRIDGATRVKDACVVSRLTHQQLADFDYSETMVKFKMISEMEARGMKGLFNGYGPNGNPKHYKFRTTHITRNTEATSTTLTSTYNNIKVEQFSEEDLLSDISTGISAHNRFLKHL